MLPTRWQTDTTTFHCVLWSLNINMNKQPFSLGNLLTWLHLCTWSRHFRVIWTILSASSVPPLLNHLSSLYKICTLSSRVTSQVKVTCWVLTWWGEVCECTDLIKHFLDDWQSLQTSGMQVFTCHVFQNKPLCTRQQLPAVIFMFSYFLSTYWPNKVTCGERCLKNNRHWGATLVIWHLQRNWIRAEEAFSEKLLQDETWLEDNNESTEMWPQTRH